MFGKPNWFRPKTFGWGLHPVTWQGWVWVACWLAVLLVPYLAFVLQRYPRWMEGWIWLGAMSAVLILDVAQLRRGMNLSSKQTDAPSAASKVNTEANVRADHNREADILYISDDPPQPIATKNYDLRLRRK